MIEFLEVYKGFAVVVVDTVLIIKDFETGEEGRLNVGGKDVSGIKAMYRSVVDMRITEKVKAETTKEIMFSLETRSGDRYDHSYFVPEKIINAGRDEIERYIISQALGDIIFVDVKEV